MGKNAAKIILILSGIIFLAHSAIPHHHHQGKVCVETEHCGNCPIPYDENQTGHDHQHGTNNNPNHCCISDFVPVSSKNNYRFNSSESPHEVFPGFHCCILSENIRFSTLFVKADIPEPDIISLYSSIAHYPLGLRAPPFV